MQNNLKVILASTSPARRDLLIQAGVSLQVIASNLDESALFSTLADKEPRIIVSELAKAKAQKVLEENSLPNNGILIAADSMWELNNELVGKPNDREEARMRILQMSNNEGLLHTGHFVMNLKSRQSRTAVVSTKVQLDQITASEVERYLDTGEPLAVAGAFTLNGFGAAFVKEVKGDANNVIGLSINTVKNLCTELELDWTDFWTKKK